jgi:16S rRNA (uracil1498-N3)-methyltransferase
MSRTCFYVGRVKEGVETLTIRGDAAHHMIRVLRLGVDDPVELRDGMGRGWSARIRGIARGAVDVQVIDEVTLNMESVTHLTLGMALARSDRMDLVIRQGTEIGVHQFDFFPSARSQYRLSGREIGKRQDRFTRIAQEAMCQCRRTVLPEIRIHQNLGEFLERVGDSGTPGKERLKVLALEGRMERSLMDIHRERPVCSEVVAAAGPEGGWTEGEVHSFKREGFLPVHLGPRILRIETATLAVMACAQLLWGDLR